MINSVVPGEGLDMKSKFITSGIPSAISCSMTAARLHLQDQQENIYPATLTLTRRAHGLWILPLDLRYSHGDEVVKLLLGVETVAEAGVLPASPTRSLPRLGLRDPLHRQHLQPAV